MDIFTLNPDNSPGTIVAGGITKAIWTERYNRPGEFLFEGDPLRLMQALPLGAKISHSKTNEVMMVEAHVIDEYEDKTANVSIVGRSIDAVMMENRVITFGSDVFGENFYPGWIPLAGVPETEMNEWTGERAEVIFDYIAAWDVVRFLLRRCFMVSDLPEENLSDFMVVNNLAGWYGESSGDSRIMKYLSLLSDSVYDILQASDVGLKTERPSSERNIDIEDPSPGTTLYFTIHKGLDKPEVEFNMSHGDLKNARYVWTNRHTKNAFYAGTHSPETFVTMREYTQGRDGWDTRVIPIDATDWAVKVNEEIGVDGNYVSRMIRGRGIDIMKQLDNSMLIDATVSKTAHAKYNTDYRMGDIVTVLGNYGQAGLMRVVEHAITQDSHGEDSVPTLAPAYFNGTLGSGGEG